MREPENNAEAAWIILEHRQRYEGLPVEWARLWVERHGPARKPVVKAERTIGEQALRDQFAVCPKGGVTG
jgi:hypothetical protein